MPKYRLHISYDGTDFCGWQDQGQHSMAPPRPSIQATLEKALSELLQHEVSVSASGRTDAGVHALNQVCHFKSESQLPKDLCWALRSKLPPSISAKAVFHAPDSFHATLSATRKTYRYWIWNHPRPPALISRFSWWIRAPLKLDRLQELSAPLVGRHDFESFRSRGTPLKSTVREIYSASWTQGSNGLFEFRIDGNGFMKQMVRNIVGTVVGLSQTDATSDKVHEIIGLRDRQKAGVAAPPQGLFLYRVEYPKSLDIQCRQI